VAGIFHIVIRSVKFYKKPVLYQVLLIALFSAVITGSLLTGRSVKESLKKSASERLGNTGILINTGVRYFEPSLAEILKDSVRIKCVGILEINSSCQSLISQKSAFNTHVFGIKSDFFVFHGKDPVTINPGEVAINKKLAEYLGLNTGDELIIRFREISDIPGDAPFSPAKASGGSIVMKIGRILEPSDAGNFSLSINQIIPMNIFMNLSDLKDSNGKAAKMNRLLIEDKNGYNLDEIESTLTQILKPSDIGLTIRKVNKTGEFELVSDRIFLEETLIKKIKNRIPSSAPVYTYLANRLNYDTRSTPYSFISALPSSLYPEISDGNGMIINKWLAGDLGVSENDTVEMFWYSPDSLNKLVERSNKFVVMGIAEMQGIWSDSLLMPDFPGISGSKSCSDWDAGALIKMDRIRQKDEDYWNKYKGTPKAFINYEKGKELFGNIYGEATSIRFPAGISKKEIEDKLSGSFKPSETGFTLADLSVESVRAANESVDFSILFISLGFFLILASIVLLSFSVSSYFDSKKDQIKTIFALGFKNAWIEKLLLLESGLIALTGCITGTLAGYFVNILITGALNSVWNGAVQTNTLEAFFNYVPILSGFGITLFITLLLITIKVKLYLKKLNTKEKDVHISHSPFRNLMGFLFFLTFTVALFTISVLNKDLEAALSFSAGTALLISLLLFWRQYYLGWDIFKNNKRKSLSSLYYSFYPANGLSPILFISAGIFAVFITGANRMDFNETHLKRSGGTGGYLLWCENAIPIKEDLNSPSGRKTYSLYNEGLNEISFVPAKRSSGDDASCLNLNHVTAPPLLGLDPTDFISKSSFTFSSVLKGGSLNNPWQFLNKASENNTIYGIADQSVLEWGLKIKIGDTLILRAENGQPLNIIIAGGLKSSVFQGYVLIGLENFTKFYPSVSGSSVLLVDGNPDLTNIYKSALTDRFGNNGINVEKTGDRLASFYEVTNTYLSVFGVFGAFGMVIGIAGLGFVILRNYNQRKKEFALMLAVGFTQLRIKKIIINEQMLILFAGVSTGIISATIATLPSVLNSPDIPWLNLFLMILAIIVTGIAAILLTVRSIMKKSLVASLKKE
jgi:putative ABC transport system permease protein